MEEDHLFHPIKARLYRNKLSGARKGYYAKADANRTLSVDEVCLSAAGRGGADIDAPAMAAKELIVQGFFFRFMTSNNP